MASAIMAFFVWLAGILPGEAEWSAEVGQEAYSAVLGGISGLVIASLTAYWLGSFSNSYVMAKMKIATTGRWVWSRTIGSTLGGQAFDTFAFFTIATLLGVFPTSLYVTLIVTNYILKVGVEIIMTPITLQVISFLKKAEGEDVFDYQTRFNPFRLDT